MSPFSTEEVAERLGIARSTLEVWIQQGKVKPKTVRIGKKTYRLWTEREIEKVRRVKKKTYRKGRGRKKKTKE
jgi:excisionase family DNA binding protein